MDSDFSVRERADAYLPTARSGGRGAAAPDPFRQAQTLVAGQVRLGDREFNRVSAAALAGSSLLLCDFSDSDYAGNQ